MRAGVSLRSSGMCCLSPDSHASIPHAALDGLQGLQELQAIGSLAIGTYVYSRSH